MFCAPLSAPRLLLTPLCVADAPLIFLLRSDPQVLRYTGLMPYTDMSQARAFCARLEAEILRQECHMWATTLAANGEKIGSICLWNLSPDKTQAEIGYDLLPEYWGHGYAPEAIRTVVDWAFTLGGFTRIFADLRADNAQSVCALEKSGFTRTAGQTTRSGMVVYENANPN